MRQASRPLRSVSRAVRAALVAAALIAMTKNDSRGFAGVDDVAKLSAAALPAAYGKIKKAYVTRLSKEFELRKGDEPDANA